MLTQCIFSGPPEYKRHFSEPAESQTELFKPSQDILKKVASLTLSKLEIDKITKPKFVPEKLDFQLYEKFEGNLIF